MKLERLLAQKEKDKQVAEALAKFAAMQSNLKNALRHAEASGSSEANSKLVAH